MAKALFIIASLAVVAAWLLVVISAAQIYRLAPPGRKIETYFDLGWWRFGKIRALIGPAAEPHIRRYRSGFLVFFAIILCVMILTVILTMPS